MNTKLGNFEIYDQRGRASIRDYTLNETIHSVNDPMLEAKMLYIEQSKLKHRLKSGSLCSNSNNKLVLWDVGLGAAFNAISAIKCVEDSFNEGLTNLCSFELISFENDLNPLKLAASYRESFPHLIHPAIDKLLTDKFWHNPNLPISWTLLEGNFFSKIEEAQRPDIVYWDPFSAKSNPRFWELTTFQTLADLLSDRSSILITYSASTAVRAGMLAAGFYVASGVGSGPKRETTIALTSKALADYRELSLLDLDWLKRWKASHATASSWLLPRATRREYYSRS
jgi:queuine tRNA-ribosyltransferase